MLGRKHRHVKFIRKICYTLYDWSQRSCSPAKINFYKKRKEDRFLMDTAKGHRHLNQRTRTMVEAEITIQVTRSPNVFSLWLFLWLCSFGLEHEFCYLSCFNYPGANPIIWTDRILFKIQCKFAFSRAGWWYSQFSSQASRNQL